MELHECPYCNMPGLVTKVKTSAGGFEVSGKCVTCGYSYASEYGPDEVARYADIQDAVRTIGQNVDVATCHVEILQDVDGRDKPGHDG